MDTHDTYIFFKLIIPARAT